LIARKFDGSKSRRYPGRPRIDDEIEQWVVRMAKENPDWGYDRIVGAMANLGYTLSDQTVGNILQRHGIPPAPERNHQGKGNVLLFPCYRQSAPSPGRSVRCRERLGGLLKYYHREAA
jgi:transposase